MTDSILRVLCLDKEGGYGGSSRSLFQSISYLSSSDVKVKVWCKREGPAQQGYIAMGIPVEVVPSMPTLHSLPRVSRNLFSLGKFFLFDWPRSYGFRQRLLSEAQEFDVAHLNIDGFYWLARWLSKRVSIPITMHKRTNPWPSFFSRFQMKVIARYVTKIVFITEENHRNYLDLGGRYEHGSVIYNIAPSYKERPVSFISIPISNDSFRCCTLANYSYNRGVDQLISVAQILKKAGYDNIIFVVAGTMELSRSLPGQLGVLARQGGDLSDYAKELGVEEMFLFLGHVTNPEQVLASCHVLIRPSRENNPWGRDVLESLAMGLPVIAAGSYNRFVEDGVTGFLLDEFVPKRVAEKIILLEKDSELLEYMGGQGEKRVQELCDGFKQAQKLLNFWSLVANRNSKDLI